MATINESPFIFDPVMQREVDTQLTGAVGDGQANAPGDVRLVQSRLRGLGMTWLPDTGTIGKDANDPTVHGIRLFLAMLDGTSLWNKKTTPNTPLRSPAAIVPGSRDETWLWAQNAPGWIEKPTPPSGTWALANATGEYAMSTWLTEYLVTLTGAFHTKLAMYRPVLDALVNQGPAALEPSSPIAARIRSDLVDVAGKDAIEFARKVIAGIDHGAFVPTVNAASPAHGGITKKHLGHQQGLECDFRLFGHAGTQAGVWGSSATGVRDKNTSLLVDGVFTDCLLDQPATRLVLHNDPVIRARFAKRVIYASGHDDHFHVYVSGSKVRTPVTTQVLVGVGTPATTMQPAPPLQELGECPTCKRAWENTSELECEADEAEAYEAESQCLPAASIRAVADYIALVQKVERAYPQWTPDQVLAALRRIAGCDAQLFRTLFATPEGSPVVPGVGGLTETDLCDLAQMSAHGGAGGVVFDPWHQEIAIGHVLCGITAGLHRNMHFGVVPNAAVSGAAVLFGLTLDNLYATTIAGDLGQSAVMLHLGKQTAGIGPGTEASEAELLGDIDGVVLASNGVLANRAISDILGTYYGAIAPSGMVTHFSHRFRLFAPLLTSATLDDQTQRFARYYAVVVMQAVPPTAAELATTLAQFRAWYRRQLAAEVAHP